jgi:hypothetical protein
VPFDPNLRDRLCELEPQSPPLRESYAMALQDMLERKLSRPMKLFLVIVAAASVAIAIFLGSLALVQERLPLLARLGLAGGAVFSLAWAALAGWTLRRGAWNLRIQPVALAALSWVLAVFMETCFLLLAPLFPEQFHAIVTLFAGLVILIGAGVMLVTTCIQQAQLRTQESLLRLEYRLAEISETRSPGP